MNQSPADLLRDLDEAPAPASTPVPREKLVVVEYTGPDGIEQHIETTHRVPSIGARQLIGVLATKLRRGVPVDAFDPDVAALIGAVAYVQVTYALPDGFDLAEQPDPALVAALYEEGSAHDAAFLGRTLDPRPRAT